MLKDENYEKRMDKKIAAENARKKKYGVDSWHIPKRDSKRICIYEKGKGNPDWEVQVMICKKCGTERYFAQPFSYRDTRFHFIDADKNYDVYTCPVCGSKDYAYLDWHTRFLNTPVPAYGSKSYKKELDGWFDSCYFKIQLNDIEQAEKKTIDKQLIYDKEITASTSSSVEKINGSPDLLKKFILYLINLEMTIYATANRLDRLYFEQLRTSRKAVFAEIAAMDILKEIEKKVNDTENSKNRIQDKIKLAQKELEGIDTAINAAQEKVDSAKSGLKKAKENLKSIKNEVKEIENSPLPDNPSKPEEPVYAKPGLFNKKKVLAENERLKLQYEDELSEYERKLSEYNNESEKRQKAKKRLADAERKAYSAKNELTTAESELKLAQDSPARITNDIESLKKEIELLEKDTERFRKEIEKQQNARGLSPEQKIKNTVDDEIKLAEDLLEKSYKARNELYASNIVFGKYRDIVALTTFYEYLMSGRCTSLEGPNGAYNLYESEVRANMIISQLSTIIEKLEDIKKNQYMIYSELQTINTNLETLSSKMDSMMSAVAFIGSNTAQIANNTAYIAYNTEVTAFYSKKNAELTDALGYLAAFK
ncbi:MAG: hypothetical protein IKD89_02520 [Clostridia bacterium]|nr:hypothetical protein [Clostridia bacterium]